LQAKKQITQNKNIMTAQPPKTKRPPVTLEEVGKAVIALHECAMGISAHNKKIRTGSSNGTVMKFKAEWLEQARSRCLGSIFPAA
jgi:hypothetical protein